MLARERQSEILRAVEASGSVYVTRLAAELDVTDETIRRDLTKLAKEGLLVRTHGGAVQSDESRREPPFAHRRVQSVEAKRAIAIEAAKLIHPGEVIGIDASTTGFELARVLDNRDPENPITVVSNGIDIVKLLADRKGVRVVSTGGELDEDGASFVGPLAESAFRQFALQRAFMSCRGFDADRGPSEASPSHAAIKRVMMDIAEESTLLVDRTKFGVRSICYVAEPAAFSRVLSSEPTP